MKAGLTLFACPKPFTDPHIRTIQTNAITSWTRLEPRPDIILCGDEIGVAGIAGRLGLKHCPDVQVNSHGTPLVSALFGRARTEARTPLLCYVNSDIIFTNDLPAAAGRLRELRSRFLMIGRRWDVDITRPVDFGGDWRSVLNQRVRRDGSLHAPTAIDYFLFPRPLFEKIPPFAIGRPAWDNYMIYLARKERMAVVDSTPVVQAVHQNHHYQHAGYSDRKEVFWGPEGMANKALASIPVFTLEDVTHELTRRGLRPVRPPSLKRYLARGVQLLPGVGETLRLVKRTLRPIG